MLGRSLNACIRLSTFRCYTVLEYIEIDNNGKTERIPLSKGINVIIGDNSVGKSMLLHALSGFEKPGENLSKSLKDGYKAYLKKKNLKIKIILVF